MQIFDPWSIPCLGINPHYPRIVRHQAEMMQAQISAQQRAMMQNVRPLYGLELLNYFRPNVPDGWRDWYEIGDALI